VIVLGSILLFGGYSFSKQMIFSIKDCFVLRQVEVNVAHLLIAGGRVIISRKKKLLMVLCKDR
jgi:hypothetical protein